MLRCTRYRVTRVADETYEDGHLDQVVADLAPADPIAEGLTIEFQAGTKLKAGDEIELSAHVVAVLTGTELAPCSACNGAGRQCLEDEERWRWRACSDTACTRPRRVCPACGPREHAGRRLARDVVKVSKVRRADLHWWLDANGVAHALPDLTLDGSLCGVSSVALTSMAADGQGPRKCCMECLQLIDYGEHPAKEGV